MSEDTFASRLRWWLQRTNFVADPFALSEADQEKRHLPGLYVDRPYLYDILGDVERLQPSFLLARRGEGKTATREMVAYECEKLRLKDRVLAVRYYDYDYLLELAENNPSQITAKHHAYAITRTCMKVMAEDIPAPYFERIKNEDRPLFATYVKQFADPFSGSRLLKLLNSDPLDIALGTLSALEILTFLVKFVTQLGESEINHYQVVYLLVDRVDESALGSEAAISILKPLINQKPLLEAPGIAFKFFIPLEVGLNLQKTVDIRTDRVCIRQIEWDPETLRKMINQRINYYSEGQQTTFEELCVSTIRHKAVKKMIEACENSPRKLIQLCDQMIHLHVSRSQDTLLDNADLTNAISEMIQQKEVETAQASIAHGHRSNEEEEIREKGLYLDDSGHVWVDGKPIDPPLTDLEFQLLRNLYIKSPNIVPTMNLIDAIWPSRLGGDDQNLRKLIGRLRKRLETNSPGSESRFIRNSKGRGYWLNLDS